MSENIKEYSVGSATVSKVGQLRIFNYSPDNRHAEMEKETNKKHISFYFTNDNSGSMGGLTREAANCFCNGLIGKVPGCTTSGTLILFDTEAVVLAKDFTNPAVVTSMAFPRQGRTNLTAGVQKAIDCIVAEDKELKYNKHTAAMAAERIHTLVFLSDGAHNEGPQINETILAEWKKVITQRQIKLAIIVVGIYSNDTTIGMRVKSIETCRITGLDPVYYAKDGAEMRVVLPKLVEGLSSSLASGTQIEFAVKGAHGSLFLENMKNTISPFVDNKTVGVSYCLPVIVGAQQTDNKIKMMLGNQDDENEEDLLASIPQLYANGVPVPVRIVSFNEKDISTAIQSLMPILSQERVANGTESIAKRQEILEKTLDIAEQIVSALALKAREAAAQKKNKNNNKDDDSDNTQKSMDGAERARQLRLAKQTRHMFAEERASLARLNAKLSDDSSQMAAFLNGASRKYAAKALIRADQIGNITADSIVNSLRGSFLAELKVAVEKDKKLMQERSQDINDNLIPSSMLSLQTALETYEDWISILDKEENEQGKVIDVNDIYSCLVAFSLLAHPVHFAATNAAQMQPLQTICLDVDPTNIDTGSLFLARQGGFTLKGSMGKNVQQAFALVDPSCPNVSSLILRKSQIAQLNNSVTICSDLYMQNPEQNLAQHVHTFVKACEKYSTTNKSRAYLNLAVKILYSFRRMFSHSSKIFTDKHTALFNRWFQEHNTITTSEEDQCDHPYLLPFMLACSDLVASSSANDSKNAMFDKGTPREAVQACLESRQPILNLVNEWLARRAKMILSGLARTQSAQQNSTVATVAIAHEVLKKYYGITQENSPRPLDDVLANEPSIENVKETCRHYVNADEMNEDALVRIFTYENNNRNKAVNSAEDIVLDETRAVYLAFKFARAIQLYFVAPNNKNKEGEVEIKNWKDLMSYMEKNLEAPTSLANFVDQLNIVDDDLMDAVILPSSSAVSNNKNNNKAQHQHNAFGKGHVYQSMISQALLYHESATRAGVDEHDVADPVTLQEMIVSLRMGVYFDRCQIKRQEYLAVIGNVSYSQALTTDAVSFASMLGVHTHGLNRQQFWAFLKATAGDEYKQIVFREKSNHSLKAESAFKAVLNKALGRKL